MKNYSILLICALLILLMSQTTKPKTTICKKVSGSTEAHDYILQKASEGYNVKTVTSFSEGISTRSYHFLIVMER